MKKAGFYMIKDSFFEVMSDPSLKEINKGIDHIIIALKMMNQEFIG